MAWSLRRAADGDAAAVAMVHRRSMRTAMPWLPELHSPEEDLAFFATELQTPCGWVAVEGGSGDEPEVVVGFAIVRDGWLRHLYVDPDRQGQGIGSALLNALLVECADVGAPDPSERPTSAHSTTQGLQLWAFQRNVRALDFYRARGFVEVERTDGSGNEEREPDVRMRRG